MEDATLTTQGNEQSLSTEIQLDINGDDIRIDSRIVAARLGITHKRLRQTIYDHKARLEALSGTLREETATWKTETGGAREGYYLLSEDQAIFVSTLSANTEQVVNFKFLLVQAFSEARRQITGKQQSETIPLPTYAETLRLYADEMELRQIAEAQVSRLKPLAENWELFKDTRGWIDLRTLERNWKMAHNGLFELLRRKQVLYYEGLVNRVRKPFSDAGYFKYILVGSSRYDSNKYPKIMVSVQEGIDFIKALIDETIDPQKWLQKWYIDHAKEDETQPE